jgi:hypothetical protein
MSDPLLALYTVSAEGGAGAAIHLFMPAETPNQAGQVHADFAKVVRIGVGPEWPVTATAGAMSRALAGRVPDDPCLHGATRCEHRPDASRISSIVRFAACRCRRPCRSATPLILTLMTQPSA